MENINRLITNICASNLKQSKAFYTTLFNLTISYDSDWFVHLTSPDSKIELGIVDIQHEIIPKQFQKNPQGIYLTFVVNSVDELYKIAIVHQFNIVKKPHDTFYGQRRLLLQDPDGTLIDISSLIQ